jgi:hypothetical protein
LSEAVLAHNLFARFFYTGAQVAVALFQSSGPALESWFSTRLFFTGNVLTGFELDVEEVRAPWNAKF